MARCTNCNKKMGLIEYECKCDGVHCQKCRYPETHSCQYDYKTNGKLLLEKKLDKVVNEKIIRI
jgi:AN1-type zinc finger and ubiquitin domain-containing protein 1